MPTYAQVEHVTPRLGGRVVDATTDPSHTAVTTLLDQAEAELLGKLASVGIPTSYATGTQGALILQGWVARYVSGLVRQTHAAAGGDGANDDGRPDIEWWDALFARIDKDPAAISAMLGGSSSSTSLGIGSHATDPALGLSDADVAPTFERGRFNF